MTVYDLALLLLQLPVDLEVEVCEAVFAGARADCIGGSIRGAAQSRLRSLGFGRCRDGVLSRGGAARAGRFLKKRDRAWAVRAVEGDRAEG
jgi:hypothetical protein